MTCILVEGDVTQNGMLRLLVYPDFAKIDRVSLSLPLSSPSLSFSFHSVTWFLLGGVRAQMPVNGLKKAWTKKGAGDDLESCG